MRNSAVSLCCFLAFCLPLTAAIVNGDFESGPHVGWTETSTNFGTPWCNAAGCGTGGGTTGPHSGAAWYWFGGTGDEEAGSAQQLVRIPASAHVPMLNFWLWVGIPPQTDAGYLNASVDGTVVFHVDSTNSEDYPSYTLVSIPMAAWADGGNHLIRFDQWNRAGESVNFSVDDVSLSEAVPEPATPLLLGAGALVFALARRSRRFWRA